MNAKLKTDGQSVQHFKTLFKQNIVDFVEQSNQGCEVYLFI